MDLVESKEEQVNIASQLDIVQVHRTLSDSTENCPVGPNFVRVRVSGTTLKI
jgi:hypothetical protein